MRRQPLAILLLAPLLAAAASPMVGAHGGPPPSYDPLILNIDGWPTADGKIADAAPEAGIAYFPAYNPPGPAVPLTFTENAPVKFTPQGFHVILALRADQPMVSEDQTQKTLQIDVLVDGKPVDGMSTTWDIGSPTSGVGQQTYGHIDMILTSKAPITIDEGAKITLQLTPLMAAMPDKTFGVVVGPSAASTADFQFAQVPTVYDLHVNPPTLQQFDMVTQNATFADPEQATNDIEVFHDHIQTNYVTFFKTKAYLVMKGAELSTDAQLYHGFPDAARRLNATHDFLVGGQFVRVHPGVATVVEVDLTNGPSYLACIRNCPQPLNMTLYPYRSLQSPTNPGTSTLTNSTPTVPTGPGVKTADANSGTEKKSPGVALEGALIALAGTALLVGRRRT